MNKTNDATNIVLAALNPFTRRSSCRAMALATVLMFAGAAHANSTTDASRASINASMAIPVTLIAGTAQFFRDAGQLSVTGVKTAGNVSTITLRGLASGAEASVQVASGAIEGSAIAAGVVLDAAVSVTGTLLISSGKALMFVPNEMGRSLLHHSRARVQ